MSVTTGPTTDLWTVPQQSRAAVAALAATRATTFIRAQVQWLQRGLSFGDDRVAVEIVLGAHDRSHDRWVHVINHVAEHLGPEGTEQLAAVYNCVGRTVESLENGSLGLLGGDLATRARDVRARELEDVSEQAVEELWRIAAER